MRFPHPEDWIWIITAAVVSVVTVAAFLTAAWT